MDAFAHSTMDYAEPFALGDEGLKDIRIIEAIKQAADTGKRVEVDRGR